MTKRNRLFAILLALAMMVTYMPGSAYAETIPDGDQPLAGEEQSDTSTENETVDVAGLDFDVKHTDGETEKTVRLDNTATEFRLKYAIQCSAEEAEAIQKNYDVVKAGKKQYFAFDKSWVYNESMQTLSLEVIVRSNEGLDEGTYICNLVLSDSERKDEKSLDDVVLNVLNYDPADYSIRTGSPCFQIDDPGTEQGAMNTEKLEITNTGNGPVTVSGDSYEILEGSDTDAFIIEPVDEEKTLMPRETWEGGLIVGPKGGVEEGVYDLYIKVTDETGYAEDYTQVTYRAGYTFMRAVPEKVELSYSPEEAESVTECEVLLDNISDIILTNVSAESSKEIFSASIEAADCNPNEWGYPGRVKLKVSLTEDQPEQNETGEITVTATTRGGSRIKPLKIPVSLKIAQEEPAEPPHIDKSYTESEHEFSVEVLSSGEESNATKISVNYYSGIEEEDPSILSKYIGFKLGGKDAEHFEISAINYSEQALNIVPVKEPEDAGWEPRIYNFTLNLYYDPDGNVATEGDLVDSMDFKVEVYNESDYRLSVLDEEENEIDGVSFGNLLKGYTEEDANRVKKTITIRNDGANEIELGPEYFQYDEPDGEDADSTSRFVWSFPDGTKTIAPKGKYTIDVAPATGSPVGLHSVEAYAFPANGRSTLDIPVDYSVSSEGMHTDIVDEDGASEISGPDGSGAITVTTDLGVFQPSDKIPEGYAEFYVANTGTVPVLFSLPSGYNEGDITCGFTAESEDGNSDLTNEMALEPGGRANLLVSANNAAKGKYEKTFELTATADNYEPVTHKINASYEITDEKCKVTFDFRGKGNYTNVTYDDVAKGSSLDDVLKRLYQGLDVGSFRGLEADGLKCVGYSYDENGTYNSWDEYYKAFDAVKDSKILEEKTVYFDWAQTIDSIKITTGDVECGYKAEKVKGDVSIDGLGTHCQVKSIDVGTDYDNYLEDSDTVSRSADSEQLLYHIRLTPEYGWVVGEGKFNDSTFEAAQEDGDSIVSEWESIEHSLTLVAGTGATCESDGARKHYKCKGCEQLFTDKYGEKPVTLDQLAIPAKGHRWDKGQITKEPTCAKGEKTFKCTVCGEIKTEEIDATGVHTEEVIPAVEATCVGKGATEGKKCSVCGEILVAPEEIPATGEHTEEVIPAVEATCVGKGATEGKKCSVCGEILEAPEEIPATGEHVWSDAYTVDRAATYAAEGSKSIHCSVCNSVKPDSAVSTPKLVVKAVALKKLTRAKRGFKVKWKKGSDINGYEIQYARNKKFTKSKKTVRIKKKTTASKKIKKLKRKKRYYVRIRAYKIVSGKKYYSAWSKVKTVKTK